MVSVLHLRHALYGLRSKLSLGTHAYFHECADSDMAARKAGMHKITFLCFWKANGTSILNTHFSKCEKCHLSPFWRISGSSPTSPQPHTFISSSALTPDFLAGLRECQDVIGNLGFKHCYPSMGPLRSCTLSHLFSVLCHQPMPVTTMSCLVPGPQASPDPASSPLFLGLSLVPLVLWGAPGVLWWVLSAKEHHSPSHTLRLAPSTDPPWGLRHKSALLSDSLRLSYGVLYLSSSSC